MSEATPRRRSRRGVRWPWLLTPMATMLLASPAGAQSLIDATRGLDLNSFNTTVGSGARAWGMGGAFVAVADDATAATWNPAGLAILQRPEITLVYVPADDGSFDYQGFATQTSSMTGTYTGFASQLDSHYIDYAGFAYPVVSDNWILVPQLSYQRAINRDFRLTQRIPSFFAAADLQGQNFQQSLLERSTQSQQGYDVIAASLAWSPRQEIAVGASINWWNVDVELADDETISTTTRSFLTTTQEVTTIHHRLDQNGDALNANLGVMWRPIPRVAVGLVYKTGFDLDLRVDDVTETTTSGGLDTNDRSGSGTINWPETMALGISGRPIQQLLLSADWTTTNWSKTTYQGDRAGVPVDEPFPGGAAVETQEDSRQLRLGAEYALTGQTFAVPFRAGFFTDRQILRDDAGETVEIHGYSIGSGIAAGHWFFDLAIVRTKWNGFRTAHAVGFDITPRGDGQLEAEGTRVYLSAIYRFAQRKKDA
jgi:long-chain fatty acid transport protein